MIELPGELLKSISRHGEAEYPHEACGMLVGSIENGVNKIVAHILPLQNARDGSERHNRFLITPADFARGMLFAQNRKLEILGFYHSHPDHPAEPSAYDLEQAWPFYSYIIVSITSGKAGDLTSWVLENDRSQFVPEYLNEGE